MHKLPRYSSAGKAGEGREVANEVGLENHFIFARLGECYFKKKDYNKAIRYLRRAVNGEPDNLSFQNSLAICNRDAGEFEEALSVYNAILRKDNDNCTVMFNKSYDKSHCGVERATWSPHGIL